MCLINQASPPIIDLHDDSFEILPLGNDFVVDAIVVWAESIGEINRGEAGIEAQLKEFAKRTP